LPPEEAKEVVTKLLDVFGFDTVDAGPLKEGWRIQRDTPGYGPRRNADELRKDLAAAKRYRDIWLRVAVVTRIHSASHFSLPHSAKSAGSGPGSEG
jgi:hypothetical protein